MMHENLILKISTTLTGALATSACSTIDSRMNEPPVFAQTTSAPLASIQGCITQGTTDENVSYLPTEKGGMLKSTAGPQNYVFWIVNIDDLGAERRVTVHAINSGIGNRIAPKVRACI